MTTLWKVVIRPQSERNIQLEYRYFQRRNVSLKIYVNKDGSLGQWSESKIKFVSWPAT